VYCAGFNPRAPPTLLGPLERTAITGCQVSARAQSRWTLKERARRCRMDSTGSKQGPMTGSWEHGLFAACSQSVTRHQTNFRGHMQVACTMTTSFLTTSLGRTAPFDNKRNSSKQRQHSNNLETTAKAKLNSRQTKKEAKSDLILRNVFQSNLYRGKAAVA
jgi:hypothetical protein